MPKKTAQPAEKNLRCRLAREMAGITIEEAARKLGRGVSTLRSWESPTGSAPRDYDNLVNMCRLYGITTDWYLEGREPMLRTEARLPETLTELIEKLPSLTDQQLIVLNQLLDMIIR